MAKITIISYWYYPSMGAASDRIKNIVDFFISKDHKVTLLTEKGNPISNGNPSIIQLRFKGRKLLDTIKSTNPDLIIYSVPPSFGIISSLLTAKPNNDLNPSGSLSYTLA